MENIDEIEGDLIIGMYEDNQAIIENDYMECPYCFGIIFDDYSWSVQICNYCNKDIWGEI